MSSSRIGSLLEINLYSVALTCCSFPSSSSSGGFAFRICANGCDEDEVERLRVRRRCVVEDWLVEGVSGWGPEIVELRGFLLLSKGKVGRSSQR